MEIEAMRNVTNTQDSGKSDVAYRSAATTSVKTVETQKPVLDTNGAADPAQNTQVSQQDPNGVFDTKDPAMSSIESAVTSANHKMTSTRCEYSYDEITKRVSIKVYDKSSDELIREVPPEESLEMLQKMWELAGLIVDEKR